MIDETGMKKKPRHQFDAAGAFSFENSSEPAITG